MAVTHKLDISFDPLSDLTPTWTDVSSRLLEVPVARMGVDDDLAEMQPGTATFRLDNRDRALEPGFAAGAYFPNVRPLRRIRYIVNDGTTDWPQFYGYIVSWGPSWPGGMNQEAIISAVDGTMILEMDTLPLLDPPQALTYEEVVMHDEPFAYYTCGDEPGTKMEPVTGPEGFWVSRPALGEPGLIVGEERTAVRILDGNDGGRAPVEQNQLFDTGEVSLECWIRPTTSLGSSKIMTGPYKTSVGEFTAWLRTVSTGSFRFHFLNTAGGVRDAVSTTGPALSTTFHIVGTWDGLASRIYVNGVLEHENPWPGETLAQGDASQFLQVGAPLPASESYVGGITQHAAFYEKALSAERVLAHYQAGMERGLDIQLAGERIIDLATTDLWAETGMQAGEHEVAPTMMHGQSRMEAIRDAVRAEFPSSLFYFPGTSDPRYLQWDYGDSPPFDAPSATFGNGVGELPFVDCETTDEDDLYNIVTTSREGGLAQTATDTASVDEFFPRNYSITGLIHTDDESCMHVSQAILDVHSQPDPPTRIKSITLTGDNTVVLAQILGRMPGDRIRVKHRPKGGTAIDIITHIRGRTLSVAPLDGGNRVISCTWSLAKGFDATEAEWHLGITGYSELDAGSGTTVLA